MAQALANWLKLLKQYSACDLALENASVGSTITTKTPVVAMTTNNSIIVNPPWFVRWKAGAVNAASFSCEFIGDKFYFRGYYFSASAILFQAFVLPLKASNFNSDGPSRTGIKMKKIAREW